MYSHRWFLVLIGLVLACGLASIRPAWAGWDLPEPDEDQTPLDDDGTLCVPSLVWRNPQACPQYGPATTAARVAAIQLPDPLPPLDLLPLEQGSQVAPFTYAQVIVDDAPVYTHPIEAVAGLPPKRSLGVGFLWVSVEAKTEYEAQEWYRINYNEYVPAWALAFYNPSSFQGVALGAQPERPFAWILKAVQPRLTPGGGLNDGAPVYGRYELVQIFASQNLGEEVWYLIGEDQWINQIYVGKVSVTPPPAGVPAGAAWIDIDLFEQTLAAYQGEQMAYATLVSSGLPQWATEPGLFQIWLKVAHGKMSGAPARADYYFLEDVPWSMFFNGATALHGAYWHNSFGYRHSHGCVNLAPLDAQWLFNWTAEGLWIWVH